MKKIDRWLDKKYTWEALKEDYPINLVCVYNNGKFCIYKENHYRSEHLLYSSEVCYDFFEEGEDNKDIFMSLVKNMKKKRWIN